MDAENAWLNLHSGERRTRILTRTGGWILLLLHPRRPRYSTLRTVVTPLRPSMTFGPVTFGPVIRCRKGSLRVCFPITVLGQGTFLLGILPSRQHLRFPVLGHGTFLLGILPSRQHLRRTGHGTFVLPSSQRTAEIRGKRRCIPQAKLGGLRRTIQSRLIKNR